MSAKTVTIAREHGRRLPRFESAALARRAMFEARDESLAHLKALDGVSVGFVADRSIESLRALERFYFSLYPRGFAGAKTDRRRFEAAMAFYVGAVATKQLPKARWVIEESPFAPGGYELGIATDGQTVMVGGMCGGWHATKRNTRHDALHRQFHDFWGTELPRAARSVKKPKPARPARDDAAIGREIERLLRLKSNPELLGGPLISFVRHHLKDDRITERRIIAAAESLVRDRVLEKVPCVRRRGFRYRLRSVS